MAVQAERLRELFAAQFPGSPAPRLYRAPGRVNVIGEHTDYNFGFVLPMALDLACHTAAAPNSAGQLRVRAANLGEGCEWPVEEIAGLQPRRHWSDYVIGVAQQLLQAGYPLSAMDLLIDSTVPVGAGLSSSAALEVATALALLDGRPISKGDLVNLCHRAENQFVGLPCGIMDQSISVFGEDHSALLIDCRSIERTPVRLPEEVTFLAVNTMVKHELSGSAYRNRVAECKEAVEQIRAHHPEVKSLRDAALSHLPLVSGVPLKRARHIVTENQRVLDFIDASARGFLDRMGAAMVASHESLRDDYEVSCEELDFLAAQAMGIPGVIGARMTGGGFGGCTINMLRPDAVEDFRARIAAAYKDRFGLDAQFYPCLPSQGAGEIA